MITLIFLDGLNGINYHRLMTPFLRLKAEEGINIHFFSSFDELKEFDMTKVGSVVVSRRCTVSNYRSFKRWLKGYKVKLILDNDDYWELPDDNPAKEVYKKQISHEILATIRIADEIWTPSEALAHKMRKVNKNIPYRIIPNTIHEQEEQWADQEKDPNPQGLVRFGYLGANGHQKDLLSMGMTFEDHELYCMNLMDYPDLLRAKYTMYPKDIHLYAQLYRHFDVSLSPIINTKFNRCKSNLKVIEAGYTKTAIIVSNVTPYKEAVIHNKTGMICSTPEEWRKAVKEMTLEKAQNLAGELYEYCKKHYDISLINKERLKGLV
jgi:glycosyltransferase involved in cell wall biosynthesis